LNSRIGSAEGTTNVLGEGVTPEGDSPAGEQPPQRRRLLDALRDVDQGIADMYESATRIFDDFDFPDALSLGAHAMRELMEKLPRVFDVPAGQGFSLRNRVDGLQKAFDKAKNKSTCSTPDGWTGKIDGPLAELLQETEALLRDRERDWVFRKEADRALMREMDPGPIPRGDHLAATEVEQWSRSRAYFEALAHHGHIYWGKQTHHAEFVEHLTRVEVILLSKFRPPTAADFAEIDSLLATIEGESDG
jgi:hypothetical protein